MSDDRGTVISLPQRPQIAGQDGSRFNNQGQALRQRPAEIPDFGDAEIVIHAADGVTVAIGDDLAAPAIRESREPPPFNDNLALKLDSSTLSNIGAEVIQGVDADIASRQAWIDQYTRGIDLLGLKIEDLANRGNRRNVSRAGDPLLIEAMVKYQAGAESEMLPAAGPAKVMTIGQVPQEEKQLADAFEADLNYYLTEKAPEYYPDTSQMLMHQAFCGIGYKKVYRCPIRRRPVSESVLAPDLIVSEEATDLDNALRVTHRIDMMKSQLQRMQLVEQYRKIDLGAPGTMMGMGQSAQRKIKESEGISIIGFGRPEDAPYEILECDTMLDIDHHVIDLHYERKTLDGMLLPYKVAVERNTQQVLGMWRNWKVDDELCLKQNMYVKFGFMPGLGFHNWGFLQLLGNQTRALRAILRLLIDSGMFGNFPGGIKSSKARTSTNEIAPGPGEWVDVDTTPGQALKDMFMPMPYKPIDPLFVQVAADLRQRSQSLASSAITDVGEGRANIPVGTIMAFVEDKVQTMSAVFKRNHRAQKDELRKLRQLFEENPEDLNLLTRDRPQDPNIPMKLWEKKEEFSSLNLVPASDPNIPSRIHRLMIDNVMAMLAQQAPQFSNIPAILKEIYQDLGKDPDQFVITPPPAGSQPPPPDPKVQAATIRAQSDTLKTQTQAKTAEDRIQLEHEQLAVEASKSAADNQTTRDVAHAKNTADALQPYHEASASPPPPAVPEV